MGELRTLDELAALLRERHGDNALPYIAQQLGCAMIAGDETGTRRWHAVADFFMREPDASGHVGERNSA